MNPVSVCRGNPGKNEFCSAPTFQDLCRQGAATHRVILRKPTPISVYDTALWMAVSVLSEQSITLGSSPVFMPDFTGGKWIDAH